MRLGSTWLILGLAVLAGAAGGYWQRHRQAPLAAEAGQIAPELSLPGLDGRTHRLADYRGRRMLLNFWASWCGPCLDELPALVRAHRDHPGTGVVGIAMDEPARVRAFLAAHPVDYPILFGDLAAPSTSLRLGDRREVLPYSVLLDADGRILAAHAGPLAEAQLRRWLDPAERNF